MTPLETKVFYEEMTKLTYLIDLETYCLFVDSWYNDNRNMLFNYDAIYRSYHLLGLKVFLPCYKMHINLEVLT